MTNPPASNLPVQQIPWSEVARTCRRICLLREDGNPDEAAHLQAGPLADMIASRRTPADTDEAIAARLELIFSAETERVANAVVLAGLLAPMLLRPSAPAIALRPVADALAPLQSVAGSRAAAAGIADFIDEMIAQENAAHDDTPPRHRRAS